MVETVILACVIAYGIGSLPIGYLLVKWRTGDDIRTQGSGTIGAFNVGRRLGAWAFALTALLDGVKGAAAILTAQQLGVQGDALAAVGLALIIGHDLPVWLRGRGGNGLAPASGALLVWDARVFGGLLVVMSFVTLFGLLVKPLGVTMRVYTPSKLAVLVSAPLAFALGMVGVPGLIGLLLITAVILLSVAGNMRRLYHFSQNR